MRRLLLVALVALSVGFGLREVVAQDEDVLKLTFSCDAGQLENASISQLGNGNYDITWRPSDYPPFRQGPLTMHCMVTRIDN